MYSVSVNQEFVDGNSLRFSIPGNADVCGGVAGLDSVRLYDMVISSTTSGVPTFLNVNQLVLEMNNVRLLNTGAYPSLSLSSTTANGYFRFTGCEFKSGIAVSLSALGQFLEIAECEIWNNGNIAVIAGEFPTVSIHDNNINAGNILVATALYDELNNISIIDNKLINCNATYGDIIISSSVANTYVNNIQIEGNLFTWIGGVSEKILISPIVTGSGTWKSFQTVSVRNNSVNGSHTAPTLEDDLGAVGGPWCSATSGNETYKLPSHAVMNESFSSFADSINVRIGPFFIGVTKLFEPDGVVNGYNAEAYYASSASVSCQQVDGIATDGVVVRNVIANLAEDQGHLIIYDADGRFRVGRLTLSFEGRTSNDAFTYPLQGRVVLHWGHRCDIGKSSTTF
jgi:hypothetical protein